MNSHRPRVLHAASLLAPSSGMLQQMRWEQAAAHRIGIPWRTRMYCPPGTAADDEIAVFDGRSAERGAGALGGARRWLRMRRDYHAWLDAQLDDVDALVLRYYVHDPYQLAFVKRCSKPVFFMSHTLPVQELAVGGGLRSAVRSRLESVIGRHALSASAGLFGISQEVVDHEGSRPDRPPPLRRPYFNGILYDEGSEGGENEVADERSEDLPELLFVAHFLPWQGLEELMESMDASDERFVLHLVGKVPETLGERVRADPRIQVHGVLDHDAIAALARRCWIGLSNLELRKKNMTENSPLKVRQYLMLGLPVFGNRDVFPASFPYYREGGSDIATALAFARDMRDTTRAEVAVASRPYIDKERLLGDLYRTLTDALGS